jgi:hypothetical protein
VPALRGGEQAGVQRATHIAVHRGESEGPGAVEIGNMMLIVSSAYGQTLVFTDRQSLENVAKQLKGQLEWIDAEDVQPPYIYHQAEHHVPVGEIDQWTDWLKYALEDKDPNSEDDGKADSQ